MWGWLAKAGAWAWAHKTEVGTAVQVWKKLRARRAAKQRNDETAKDYYKREGKDVIESTVRELTEGD